MAAETEKVELDIRGQICPSCLLLTLKAVNQNSAGLRRAATEVVVFTDDRMAVNTIPDAVGKMGFQAEISQGERGYCIRVTGG
jgi:hypothetical protein